MSGASFRVRSRSCTSGIKGVSAGTATPGILDATRAARSSGVSRRMNWPLSQSSRSRFATAGLAWILLRSKAWISCAMVKMSWSVPGDHPRKAMKLSTASGR